MLRLRHLTCGEIVWCLCLCLWRNLDTRHKPTYCWGPRLLQDHLDLELAALGSAEVNIRIEHSRTHPHSPLELNNRRARGSVDLNFVHGAEILAFFLLGLDGM